MPIVDVHELKKNYSGEQALNGVTFSVDAGKLFGIIGADGAGKTTLMRILVTLLNPDSGDAHILNYNIVNNIRTIREKIGYMPQRFSLYGDLSVKENLTFFADVFNLSGKERKERMTKLLQFSRLEQFQKRRASNLSGGMKQKLALSCALIHSPKLLILDEPTTGVDPVSRREFWEILKDLRNDGVTIIVSTPYMDEAALCDELLIMHNGKILKNGTPDGLVEEYPYDLYKIGNEDKTVTCSSRITLPSCVIQMYPSGGAVHVAVKRDFQLDAQLQNQLLESINDAKDIKKVQPDIEDLFFMLIAENGIKKADMDTQKA
jgi:ABC-type multidrug transport system ATPase subunit